MADDGDDQEQRKLKDFTQLVDQKLPEYTQPVKNNPALLNGALDNLLALEKKTRLAADAPSTARVAEAIIELCYECKQWPTLIEHVSLLCKRRAQLKKVQQVVIEKASQWVESTPTKEIKRELLNTLRSISEGKLFVELQRAKLTRTLAEMEEAEGKITEAATILQEVQVETIGSMEIKEKADFLLEQLRLLLECKDHVRADLVQRKVNTKVLQKEDMQDLKLKYYNLMVRFYAFTNDQLATCKAYRAIFDTPKVQQDPVAWKNALTQSVMFLALSQFDSEVSDLLHRIKTEKKLEELPSCKQVLTLLTTEELAPWPLPCDAEWRQHPVFANSDNGQQRYTSLRKRIVQHNMRVLAGYYHRITSQRFAQLLSLNGEESEELLCELVSSKQLFAKIDRPSGIITFTRRESPNAVLNNWAGDINQLLGLVETTCHLINKENMIHKMKTAQQ